MKCVQNLSLGPLKPQCSTLLLDQIMKNGPNTIKGLLYNPPTDTCIIYQLPEMYCKTKKNKTKMALRILTSAIFPF